MVIPIWIRYINRFIENIHIFLYQILIFFCSKFRICRIDISYSPFLIIEQSLWFKWFSINIYWVVSNISWMWVCYIVYKGIFVTKIILKSFTSYWDGTSLNLRVVLLKSAIFQQIWTWTINSFDAVNIYCPTSNFFLHIC